MNAVVVRLERLKNSKVSQQRRHDLRDYTDKNRPDYIDSTKSHLNSILIKPKSQDELLSIIQERRKHRKKGLRKNAVWLWSGLVAFGHEAQQRIESLSREQQDKLFYQIVKKIADYLQTDIESLSIHRDESAVHCHFTLLNFTKDGTTLSQKLKPQVLSYLQDLASKTLQEMGLNIQRGKRKIERLQNNEPYWKVIHRTVKQLHRDLPIEYMRVKKAIKVKTDELESLQKRLEELQKRESELLSKIQTHEERIQKLQEKISKYEKEYQDYQDKITQANKTLQVYENRKTKAQKELTEIQSQITQERERLQKITQDTIDNEYKTKYELVRENYYSLVKTIQDIGYKYPKLQRVFVSYRPDLRVIFPELNDNDQDNNLQSFKPKP